MAERPGAAARFSMKRTMAPSSSSGSIRRNPVSSFSSGPKAPHPCTRPMKRRPAATPGPSSKPATKAHGWQKLRPRTARHGGFERMPRVRPIASSAEPRGEAGRWLRVSPCAPVFANERHMKPTQGIDLELFRHLLVSIAEEMGVVLRKTSYSANIKERRDYSCAVYDADGGTVAMGDHMPVHLGAMPLSVQAVREVFDLAPGDVALVNDPFRGGTHLPDITAVAPVFVKQSRKPAFYLANRAHHSDVGGMSPGSMPLAREIYQEGIRIPPILIQRGGVIDRELL